MGRRVVLVEDDEAFRYAAHRHLEQADFLVESYATSTEAWPSVGPSATLDVLVTDMMLGEGTPNGVSLARNAVYHHPKLLVIYVTAHSYSNEYMREDGSMVLTKPFSLDVLVELIELLIDQRDHPE
jgi:DNA-binding NtrC family response regulator